MYRVCLLFIGLLIAGNAMVFPGDAKAQLGWRSFRQPNTPNSAQRYPSAYNPPGQISVPTPPAINTRASGIAVSVEDLERMDFRNPSLLQLRELGKLVPRSRDSEASNFPRISGEFEPQKAILVSISDLMYQHFDVLKQLIRKTYKSIPLVILVNDQAQLQTAIEIADSTGGDMAHLSFLVLKLDTIWLRDFGPRFIELADGRAQSIDFLYDGSRPKDDNFPANWALRSTDKNRNISWTLQGGNLLSNGHGLGVTSTRIFDDNMIQFPNPLRGMNVEYERRKIVVENFKQECNFDQLVFLHPLAPEATKHVDMFMTFLAKNHVLVAELDPRIDAYNADVLNQNAAILATVEVDKEKLRVDRIQIPARDDKYWSPYTNIILANELILMPVYDTDPPRLVKQAVDTYRKLMPGVEVKTINLTSMRKLEGALHCMSVNVPAFAKLPRDTITYADAKRRLSQSSIATSHRQPTPTSQRSQQPPLNQPNVGAPKLLLSGGSVKSSGVNQSSRQSSPFENVEMTAGRTADATTKQRNPTISPSNQRAAAATYRRTFIDRSNSFSLDAVAIGISSTQVYLLRPKDRLTVRVKINELSDKDQAWVASNTGKIQLNGELVRNFYLKYGF